MRVCWCGNGDLRPFGAEYGECQACGTLVYLKEMAPEQLLVRDDEADFYGKKYWTEHQRDTFGFADIHSRARNDFTERNLHWLKALLRYRLPPADILELGCAHASFVALMRQAGYAATGMEMSPWVVDFGTRTFAVPVSLGPVETLDVPLASLDAIVLMDVLEHLGDPAATLRRCLELLKPDGLLLIQTPQFKEGMRHEMLVESDSRFLEMLIPQEHIYLFSERSVKDFFHKLGADHIQFEPAIFAHYDMFFAVSRSPLTTHTSAEIEAALFATPNGRVAMALLDLRERELNLVQRYAESEADRLARSGQIETLSALLKESETDRAKRAEQIETLSRMLKESEQDRTARGEQIETLSRLLKTPRLLRGVRVTQELESAWAALKESETDRARRMEQIETLTRMLKESEVDRMARGTQIETLTQMVKESELDRAKRAEQIEILTLMVKEYQAGGTEQQKQIQSIKEKIDGSTSN